MAWYAATNAKVSDAGEQQSPGSADRRFPPANSLHRKVKQCHGAEPDADRRVVLLLASSKISDIVFITSARSNLPDQRRGNVQPIVGAIEKAMRC